MKPLKGEKTPLDELFRATYDDELSDLIEEIEVVDLDQTSEFSNSSKTNNSPKSHSKTAIVIQNIEVSTTGFKIGQIHLQGMLAKTLIVLAAIGLLYHLI
jgi:hypothetical protein